MMRLLPFVVVGLTVLVASCAPRYDLSLAWTIDGEDAASACDSVDAAVVRVHSAERSTAAGLATETTQDVACARGAASIDVGPYNDVVVELLSGKNSFGVSTPQAVDPDTNLRYAGATAEAPLRADIAVSRGALRARFTVLGQDCGDAGVASFNVTLSKTVNALNNAIVAQDVAVACTDGVAIYSYAPAAVGTTYQFQATAGDYATEGGIGEGVQVQGVATTTTIDLR